MATAVDYYNRSLQLLQRIGRIVGLEFWAEERRFKMSHVLSHSQMWCFFILTIQSGYSRRDNLLHILESQIFLFMGIGVSFKFVSFFLNRNRIRHLTDSIETGVYGVYERTSSEYPVVSKYSRIVHMAGHALLWGYLGSMLTLGVWPVVEYIRKGRRVLMFTIEIPFVDWTTRGGYWMTTGLHLLWLITGSSSLVMYDYLCAFLVIHGLLYVDIFMQHLHECGERLACLKGSRVDPSDHIEIQHRWKQCLSEHQHIVEYFQEFSDLWSVVNLVHVGCSVLNICLNMLLLLKTDWYATYAIHLVFIVDLSLHFLLGGIIERKTHTLDLALIQFPWYELTVSQQKEYKLMLMRSQKPFGLSIAGLAPVNYETYTRIMKMLYQLFTLALNFMK